jgi:hypothetical protein
MHLKLQNASNFYSLLDTMEWSNHEVSDRRLWKILERNKNSKRLNLKDRETYMMDVHWRLPLCWKQIVEPTGQTSTDKE